jgi:predicted enzyme related to lactoylglutathione lyase
VPPTDIAVGRFTHVADPDGGHFTMFKALPQG